MFCFLFSILFTLCVLAGCQSKNQANSSRAMADEDMMQPPAPKQAIEAVLFLPPETKPDQNVAEVWNRS